MSHDTDTRALLCHLNRATHPLSLCQIVFSLFALERSCKVQSVFWVLRKHPCYIDFAGVNTFVVKKLLYLILEAIRVATGKIACFAAASWAEGSCRLKQREEEDRDKRENLHHNSDCFCLLSGACKKKVFSHDEPTNRTTINAHHVRPGCGQPFRWVSRVPHNVVRY